MEIDGAAIRKVVEAFENSEWDEVHLQAEGFELLLVAEGCEKLGSVPTAPGPEPQPAPADREVPPAADVTESVDWSLLPAGAVEVVSPTLGIFWRAPRPDAPPFVAPGDDVEAGATLCIVEVMKLMTPLKAEQPGRIVAVLASNGQQVQKGGPLFAFVPREAS